MNSKKSFAVGIDLGATTIKAGVVEKNGSIPDQFSVDSKANKGPKMVIQQIIFTIQELFGRHKPSECAGIGIGTPGLVSIDSGTVQHPPNFVDWGTVDITKEVG
jgi:glucokinase